MKNPTDKQLAVLAYIRDYLLTHGIPPTIREISNHLECSVNNAQMHLMAMHRKGLIRRIPNISRGIQLIERTEAA